MILRDHPHEAWVRPEREDDIQRPHRVRLSRSGRSTNVGSDQRKPTKLCGPAKEPNLRVNAERPKNVRFMRQGVVEPISCWIRTGGP
jgi:hypothetical protein